MPWWDLGSLTRLKNFSGLFQNKMQEVQLGSHTVRSHGMRVARTHMHDWVILMLLGLIVVILNVIHPFYRFVGKDMMTDLKYPLKSNTVPVWAVPMYAVALPIAIFFIVYFRRRDVYDLHHAILGLLFSVLVTGVITDAIKDAVGRPRPDFFWRCFPDGKDVYDQLGNVVCHGKKSVIKEGHKSFPSGHTSWSFAGLGFLSLYLSGKIKVFDRKGHVAKLCIVFLPLLFASLVGVSRIDDYWHHWQDVFAGGLLGFIVATFCYLQFFPPPYHAQELITQFQWRRRDTFFSLLINDDAPLVVTLVFSNTDQKFCSLMSVHCICFDELCVGVTNTTGNLENMFSILRELPFVP